MKAGNGSGLGNNFIHIGSTNQLGSQFTTCTGEADLLKLILRIGLFKGLKNFFQFIERLSVAVIIIILLFVWM